MHIAIGITLRNRDSGGHWKIVDIALGLVRLTDDSDRAKLQLPVEQVRGRFEEFGPLYDRVYRGADGAEGPIHLERCPFCGSTNLDPAGWMSDADVNNTGPTCDDCGAQHESVDKWNARYVAPVVVIPADVVEAATRFKKNGYRGPLPWAQKVFDWVVAQGVPKYPLVGDNAFHPDVRATADLADAPVAVLGVTDASLTVTTPLSQQLPAGEYYVYATKQPAPAIPADFHSHKDAWRRALKQCIANAPPATHDTDDAGYWRHQLTAFDRAYAQLIFNN